MATVLYPDIVFGPVHSRRLGISLGINLLPLKRKFCTFDCVYCECGLGEMFAKNPLPSAEDIAEALRTKLQALNAEGITPDVLTFAGNGEPTAHPEFAAIIADTLALRNRYCPQAKVSVLSNATRAHVPEVREALLQVDNNILKLDTVDADYIRRVDRPVGRYDVNELIETLCTYNGRLAIQTLFMKGTSAGHSVDNTGAEYVQPWLEALQRIRPAQVMIYTIDRETPDDGLLKATPDELDRIARQVEALGFAVSVSY